MYTHGHSLRFIERKDVYWARFALLLSHHSHHSPVAACSLFWLQTIASNLLFPTNLYRIEKWTQVSVNHVSTFSYLLEPFPLLNLHHKLSVPFSAYHWRPHHPRDFDHHPADLLSSLFVDVDIIFTRAKTEDSLSPLDKEFNVESVVSALAVKYKWWKEKEGPELDDLAWLSFFLKGSTSAFGAIGSSARFDLGKLFESRLT